MLIFGIETSCDETSVALVKNGTEIIGLKTLSQTKTHSKYGGIVPEIASRIHVKVLHHLTNILFKESKLNFQDIDYISVTNAPGLIGALLVGVSFANAFGQALNKPVIGINHIEAHLYAPFISNPDIKFPCLALIVSGGHTLLVKASKLGKYTILGSTLDDAVGEAYDKVAKLLNLPYPGGPQIDKLSSSGDPNAFKFPRALVKKDNLNFSFSGLKTSILYTIKGIGKQKKKIPLNKTNVQNISASFQRAVVDVLVKKTKIAINKTKPKSLIVCGGVAANSELQSSMKELCEKMNIKAYIPPINLCTDNAAMIAGLAYHKQNKASRYVKEVFANQPITK